MDRRVQQQRVEKKGREIREIEMMMLRLTESDLELRGERDKTRRRAEVGIPLFSLKKKKISNQI